VSQGLRAQVPFDICAQGLQRVSRRRDIRDGPLTPLLEVLSDIAAASVEMTEREIHEQTKAPEMSLPAGRG
jgi:hypothetical protein